ncbi:MAG: acyl carrier protein, partial [SAR202 cluster bacterium]|nr:acyl carrier protein [SAR202 cluster bacterium]
MSKNERIKQVIINSISDVNLNLPKENQLGASTDTVLFGRDGKLDSLELVNLIVSVEQNIEDEFHINVAIADDRALSQKYSPFRTIGSLVEYIDILLKEKL